MRRQHSSVRKLIASLVLLISLASCGGGGGSGAILRTEYDASGTYRKYWNQYITRSAYQRGVVPIYWDNGYRDNHQFGLFDRTTGAQAYPDVIREIVNAAQ